jgi:DNA-binding transcriptional LysR family regulator
MDQLAAMRAFVRIVETGSFTRAAISLNVPKPTLTKHIQSLEAHLRTSLLSRTTRRLAVTADGAAYYERAVRLLAELDELDGSLALSRLRPKGRLRIDVLTELARQIIIPALDGFIDKYPDIQVEIGASDRPTDLIAESVDCVIRGGVISDPSLIARRIANLEMVTCAAPAYLARYGEPSHPGELAAGTHRVAPTSTPAQDASMGRHSCAARSSWRSPAPIASRSMKAEAISRPLSPGTELPK